MHNKIFCIGLNKTGTSSLHEAFQILGLKSVHFKDDKSRNIKDIIEENFKKDRDILTGIENYDAFSDWERDETSHLIFKKFDQDYPGSKFILNTRNLNDWLDSRERHVIRNQKSLKKNFIEKDAWLTVDREASKKQYIKHHNAVYKHFKNRPYDLLVFDITKGDGWEELCEFLNLNQPKVDFPKANREPNKLNKFENLKLTIIRSLKSNSK